MQGNEYQMTIGENEGELSAEEVTVQDRPNKRTHQVDIEMFL